ncbi:DeoR/GlpR family DNA-binding transcription regulator [Roseitalea porphyridii]|uniref:DeoR/GlpR transcriptional regulator n=1 Tax=Roseitalea porphyridii TaxID=1852022 RepID=A0A4P6V2J4_9HYPH|nr:DeoR/GlpR family DNA-binding transcription regulator [Roseitalea porphyridii]QBK31123.1 DeoR/GlpR transcriptional regulator [Roseitalea porphyridii]
MASGLRRNDILSVLRGSGQATVEELARRFAVTEQTIRRDLAELAAAGRIERVHGGAALRSGVANIVYEERRGLNAGAKDRIGALVARHVPANASLFINIGTTTEAVARHLVDRGPLTVVTNNINVASILAPNEGCEIIVTGGVLRRADGGLVGDLASQTIGQFKVDIAIIGASALDEAGDLYDFDLREVHVSRAIIANARAVFLVADASKFDRAAPVCIASMADVDAVFSDRALPPALARSCARWGTAVHVANGQGADA